MGGFVRMKFLARTTGDEEFIEAVRKDLPDRARRRAVHAAVGFALILAGLVWSFTVPQLLIEKLSQREGSVLALAVTYGIAVGAAAGVFILSGVRFLSDSRAATVHDRMARMLIDYHDKLATGSDGEAA